MEKHKKTADEIAINLGNAPLLLVSLFSETFQDSPDETRSLGACG